MNLDAIQSALRDAGHDGWLFYDHHHRDPIGERILGLDPKAHITRRWYYYIPAAGEPRKLIVAPGGAHQTVQHDPELQGMALRWLERELAAR